MKLIFPFSSSRRPQRGVTLIEALVALLVMSFGMVALVALLGNLRRMGDVSKQRSEAMRLALQEMANVRSFSTLVKLNSTDPTISDYATDIVSKTEAARTVPDSNTAFAIQHSVAPLDSGVIASLEAGSYSVWGKSVQVDVSWIDRSSRATDAAQRITLNTVVARVDPSFVGAVGIGPAIGGLRQAQNRNPAIPIGATDLRNNTSAFRPSGLSSTVWVFNNINGFVTSTCSIDPNLALDTTSVNATVCNSTLGFVLSGTINFSNTDPANPTVPEAAAIPLDVSIVGGSYQAARLDVVGVPRKDASGNVIYDTITVAAPASTCFDDAPSSPGSQTFVNYSCLVTPNGTTPRPYWSGKVLLTSLSLGTTATDYRVCRYSADYNGNGNGYANIQLEPDNYEHPAFYVKVAGSLARQNFLVVKGTVACPTAPAIDLANGVFADFSTIQLQP